MSEENTNRDPIEGFFEKKVWDYDIPFRESDWMSLEERLEIQEQQTAVAYRKRWLTAAAVMLAALLGFFTYLNYTQINQINRQLADREAVPQVNENENQAPAAQSTENPPPKVISDESAGLAEQQKDKQAVMDPENKNLVTVVANNSEDQINTAATGNSQRGSLPAGRSETLFVSEIECTACMLSESDAANLEASSLITRQKSTTKYTDGSPTTYFAATSGEEQYKRTSFRIGFLAGPDLSTAGTISRFQSPGYTLGLHAEYYLSPRFSLRAGMQHSTIRYRAGSNDYHPPSGYWAGNTAASRTNAECRLIDIPVNLKYEVLDFETSSFFASAGVNSYIMLNETYRFDYSYAQTNLPQEWSEKTGTGYWFSNAAFSVGYEFDVRSNWSLRVEPYLKVPLKGVGWGNVDLFSTGTLVSLNYNFSR